MNSPICVDASLIVRTLVLGKYTNEAQSLLDTWNQSSTLLIAPALLAFEVTATLRRMVYLKTLPHEQGEAAFAAFGRVTIHLTYRAAIFPIAWELAKEFNQPRTYDMSYLALAQMSQCDFWTADEKLYNTVKHKLSWVNWVGSLAPAA